jgi:FMN-dependent NADH-azoreductase
MATLLCILASPRTERSRSRRVAEALLEAYGASHPDDTVERLDLWQVDLPAFDRDAAAGKMAIIHGREHTAAEATAWEKVEAEIDRFTAADKFVFAVPMWNFGLPYRLKQYIDVITQPGYTFAVDPEQGYRGLLQEKPVCAIYARGGAYGPGTGREGFDHQRPYLEQWFGFIGLGAPRSIVVEPTLQGGAEEGERVVEDAIAEAQRLAPMF